MLFVVPLVVSACQLQDFSKLKPDFSQLKKFPASILSIRKNSGGSENENTNILAIDSPLPLQVILESSLATKNPGTNFSETIKYALETDPEIIAMRRQVEAKIATVRAIEAGKDFQVGATLYGGIEDVTDNTKGVALAVDAKRLVYDGGKLESRIAASVFELEASRMELAATLDQRASELFRRWLELEKYKSLQEQIDRRLSVLDPLIDQLEKVAKAGIGDVSKVTAAQRTVSAIRVQQTSISEGLAQAQLEFSNAFGSISQGIVFDYDFISNLVPSKIDTNLVQNSPALKLLYAEYQLSLANVEALKAEKGLDVGFEARVMRPYAGSNYDSDESIGLVGRKTLFNGGMLESQIKEAQAVSQARLAELKAAYRKGARDIEAAIQNIESMEKAILIARESAKLTSDEIVYLRQQLVIGGSTLDNVLSAEARLYEAESKEINFLTDKYKSEVLIAMTLGLFGEAFGL